MIDHALLTAAFRHRMGRRIAAAGRRVDVAFDETPEGVAPSAAAARLAEDLVAEQIGCERRLVHVAAMMPSGRPVAAVRGRETTVGVSLAHAGGLVGAAVCAVCGVGLDIVDAAAAGPNLDIWFTSDELATFRDHGRPRARLWAAKEAAFKAAGLDEGFRPLAVAIGRSGTAGFRWSVRGNHRNVGGEGVFAAAGRQVVAVALATASMSIAHPSRSA
jgi:phosphopantetheinyl transferase (holo-ACP synthase)